MSGIRDLSSSDNNTELFPCKVGRESKIRIPSQVRDKMDIKIGDIIVLVMKHGKLELVHSKKIFGDKK